MTYRYKFQRDIARTVPPSLAPHSSSSACGIGSAGRAQFGGGAVTIRHCSAFYQFCTISVLASHRNLQRTAWQHVGSVPALCQNERPP